MTIKGHKWNNENKIDNELSSCRLCITVMRYFSDEKSKVKMLSQDL